MDVSKLASNDKKPRIMMEDSVGIPAIGGYMGTMAGPIVEDNPLLNKKPLL